MRKQYIIVSQQCTVCGTKLLAGVIKCSFCTCPYLKSIPTEKLELPKQLKPE